MIYVVKREMIMEWYTYEKNAIENLHKWKKVISWTFYYLNPKYYKLAYPLVKITKRAYNQTKTEA